MPARLLLTVLVVTLAATLGNARAHVDWFHQETPGFLELAPLLQPGPLLVLATTLGLTIGAGILWLAGRRRAIPGPAALGAPPERRAALYGVIPAMLALHLAVPLLVGAVQGRLFAPHLELSGGWPYLLGLLQIGIALALFYGALARLAAFALVLLWTAGLFLAGIEAMLENAHYLGLALFFLLAGRGPLAVDRLILPGLEPPERLMRLAPLAARVALGLSLIVLAFTEKLARLGYAASFLEIHPLNFTPALGIPLPDQTFVLLAGATELLVGLWLLLGLFTREIIVFAWFPLNLTLTVFAWEELIWHLPIYGLMALYLLWEETAENRRLWLQGLREGPLALAPARSPRSSA